MKQIVFLLDQIDKLRGSETYCIQMAKTLQEKGWKTYLFLRETNSTEHSCFDVIATNNYLEVVNEMRNIGSDLHVINVSSWYLTDNCEFMFERFKVIYQHHNDYNEKIQHLNGAINTNWRHIDYFNDAKIGIISNEIYKNVPEKRKDQAVITHNIFDLKPTENKRKGRIVYVGDLTSHQKNPKAVLEIIEKFTAQYEQYTIEVFGKISDTFYEKFENNKNVILHGFETNISNIYKDANLIFLASNFEGFPRVLIEAQSFGVPTVLANTFAAANEIIDYGNCGKLIEPGKIDEFVAAMDEVASDNSFSDNCYINYDKFSQENIYKELINVFENMEKATYNPKSQKLTVMKLSDEGDSIAVHARLFYNNPTELNVKCFCGPNEIQSEQNKIKFAHDTIAFIFKINKNDIKNGMEVTFTYNDKPITIILGTFWKFARSNKFANIDLGKFNVYFANDKLVFNTSAISKMKIEFKSQAKLLKDKKLKTLIARNKMIFGKSDNYLFMDRTHKADDNAEALYKHYQKLGKKNIYFVINFDAVDEVERLKKLGFNLVDYRTHNYKVLLSKTQFIFSSHTHFELFKSIPAADYNIDKFQGKFIFLQHGVMQYVISNSWLNYYAHEIEAIVTSSPKEDDSFNSVINYNRNNWTIPSGLPRHDFLKANDSVKQKTISVFPTWRKYLYTATSIIDTNYYQGWKNLLTDNNLQDILKNNNYKIEFILHNDMLHFIDEFKVFESETIDIINSNDIQYKDKISDSKMAITDYSSVAFDFAVLNKPTIFYQFETIKNHHGELIFNYKDDTPGLYAENSSDVVMAIKKIIDGETQQVNEDFFFARDGKNCERIVEYIKEKYE